MELKRLITHFTYRIEPKPEGGFVAHASDPTLQPLEAATREELQQKIQANIATALAAEFPGLKLPAQSQELKFDFHIEHKPGGGFAIHSADPKVPSIEAGSHAEVESRVAEKLAGFVGKYLAPELTQALAAQASSGHVKVIVNRKVGFTFKAGSSGLSVGTAEASTAGASQGNGSSNAAFGTPSQIISSSPILPETSSSWKIFAFLLAAGIVSALMYFVFYHR
jgi:hypothetical protein